MPAHHFCATEGCERAGGLDANKVACKDSSYRLDVSTWQWHTFRLSPEISSPKTQTHMWPKTRPTSIVSERGQHSANLVACSSLESGKLILFGGLQSAGINKDALFDANVAHSNTKASLLVQVDVNTFHVSEPRTTGTPPCPRHSHAAAVVDLGNNRASLLIAGGMNLFSDLLCSDLYLLELGNTWAWRNLPSLATPRRPLTVSCPLGRSVGRQIRELNLMEWSLGLSWESNGAWRRVPGAVSCRAGIFGMKRGE